MPAVKFMATKKKKAPRAAQLSLKKAAGMAAATRGRARVFESKKKKAELSAREEIETQLKETEE
jgi:hypothetical protein